MGMRTVRKHEALPNYTSTDRGTQRLFRACAARAPAVRAPPGIRTLPGRGLVLRGAHRNLSAAARCLRRPGARWCAFPRHPVAHAAAVVDDDRPAAAAALTALSGRTARGAGGGAGGGPRRARASFRRGR